jgi:hypothetical protein
MKTKRIIFIILGWLFIFLQLFNYLGSAARHEPLLEETTIAYIIGYNFILIFGIAFLFAARRYKRKIQAAKEYKPLDDLLARPKSESDHP